MTPYYNQRGMTLIEILLVVGILGLILAFGMTVNFSAFTTGTLQGEESKIVSALERARSHAMANMNQTTYGVCYNVGNYVIFQGDTCPGTGSELISANTNIAEHSGTVYPTFVFDQLSGNEITSEDTIIIEDDIKTETITINN